MANYYVNGYSTGGVYPYDKESTAAPNFKTLFDNISDIIEPYDSVHIIMDADIDDSMDTININVPIQIYGKSGVNVILSKHGDGIVINASSVLLQDIHFVIDSSPSHTSGVNIKGDNITISWCSFTYAEGSQAYSTIRIYPETSNIEIRNSNIQMSSNGYAVRLDNSNECYIHNNKFYGVDSTGLDAYIIIYDDSSYITVENNLFLPMNNTISQITGGYRYILADSGNNINISSNVLHLYGKSCVGIGFNEVADTDHENTKINNNVILLYPESDDCIGIYVSYSRASRVSYYEMMNNIISFMGDSKYVNTNKAIGANILRGIIDYNNIYKFLNDNKFWDMNHNEDSVPFGVHNLQVDPKFVSTDDISKLINYNLSISSECIGMGYGHHNMGIGANNNSQLHNYINIVDSMTHDIGEIQYAFGNTTITFLNSVFTESISEANSYYRRDKNVYPSEVYNNQWRIIIAEENFPLSRNSILYSASLIDIFRNKDLFAPFYNISCPANPGYGYPDYEGYPTGLWGYSRSIYPNGCGDGCGDVCVIQDSITDTRVIRDTTRNTPQWMQNMIIPKCLI